MTRFFLVLSVLIVGCSSDTPQSGNDFIDSSKIDTNLVGEQIEDTTLEVSQVQRLTTTKNSAFLDCYNNLVIAIGTHDDSLFNHYINNVHGLYIVEAQGAVPSIFKIQEIKGIKQSFQNKTINEMLYHEMGEPVFETLPKVICDTTSYDKQGCFAAAVNPLQKGRIWNYASLNEKEIQAIEFLAETVSITVVNTSNFTFYFSKIEDKWFLTFLDLRTPCEA